MKKRASAIKSCTAEKRRNLRRASTGFVECLRCVASFIQFFASAYYKLEVLRHNGRNAPANFAYHCFPASQCSHMRGLF